VRSYWQIWKRNHYYKPAKWAWGKYKRIGRHLYRQRILRKWTGRNWRVAKVYWKLFRRNHYPVYTHMGKKKACPCCNKMKGFVVKLFRYKRKCSKAKTFCRKMVRQGRYKSVCRHMMALCRRTR